MSVGFLLDIPEVQDESSPCDEFDVHDSFCSVIRDVERGGDFELQPINQTGNARHTQDDHHMATLKILADMPSRTIGRCKGTMLSEYYNRTMIKRRSKKRPSVYNLQYGSRPSVRCREEVEDGEEEQQRLLVSELQRTPGSQRTRLLKSFPLSLRVKRQLRQLTSEGTWRQRNVVPCCSQIRDSIAMASHRCWLSCLSGLYALRPWHNSLKQIGGRFGSSVLSYFLFLKTLLGFNIFMCFLCVLLVVTPQAAHPHVSTNPRTFTSLELLTGAGYFSGTVMYYGYYSNLTLNDGCPSAYNSSMCSTTKTWLPYHMPLAYLYTIGVTFLSTCIILVYQMSCSFGDSFRVGYFSGVMALKVFCSWDFKVTRIHSVQRQRENIHMQLKEMLCDQLQDGHPDYIRKKLKSICVPVLSWSLCVVSWLGSALAVYVLSERLHKDHRVRVKTGMESEVEAMLLLLPLAVSIFNLLLPYVYHGLGLWEKMDSPMLEVYVAICRNLMLKIVILGVLCYHWLSQKTKYLENKCWETFVGQELYRFVIMDLVFTLLDTLFGELLWRIFLEKRRKQKCRTEFDIARNVLELIYGQTLAWLGVLFCPLIPVVQALKLLLLFYVKKASLMRNCRSPKKPWRASHMSTTFLTLLCFPSFLGAAVFLSYTVWSVKPSDTCGPFRFLGTMYQAGKFYIRELEKSDPRLSWVTWVHHYLWENTFFIYLATGVLLVVIYFHIQIVNGQRKIIKLLKEQISNEGEDKRFLIRRLHSVYQKKSTGQRKPLPGQPKEYFTSGKT
ncbi:transmembrane channel-like protein 6 isoform X2 [Spea bombifrons]|uniref:transmembrane channel-like protein 6 isoform X2 n=1 Tax=Spea bombifrons TaxID=233779 RepID=UPI00234A9971|nr:transmembrane channel-like protein 6 isoform X2 [Spea bombifrons]XP_053309160.1 transmembrane channel-like protein 6 isoform X2 [Spea bombifrons]